MLLDCEVHNFKNNKMTTNISSIVKTVADAEGIKCFEIEKVEANPKGEGYLGEIYTVTVLDKSSSDRRLNIVIKSAFNADSLRDIIPIQKCYQNEVYFYETLYPFLLKFLRTETGCESSKVDLVPKCLLVCLDNKMESLVFDNLKCRDFEVLNKKMYLDADHMELIFNRYGYFHALSFALKQKDPEQFSKITSKISFVYAEFFDTKIFEDMTTSLYKTIYDSLRPDEDDVEVQKAFEKYLQSPIALVKPCLGVNDEYSVLLHGDCWSNNMLFKYEKQTGKAVDMRIIDWQLINVGNPVCDLSYALYSGAPKAVYDNFDDLLKIYYDNFSLTLKQFELDANQLYPFSVLKQHWKLYSKFGFTMAVQVIRAKLTEAEDVMDLRDSTDAEAFLNSKFDSEQYNIRTKELLRHLHGIGGL